MTTRNFKMIRKQDSYTGLTTLDLKSEGGGEIILSREYHSSSYTPYTLSAAWSLHTAAGRLHDKAMIIFNEWKYVFCFKYGEQTPCRPNVFLLSNESNESLSSNLGFKYNYGASTRSKKCSNCGLQNKMMGLVKNENIWHNTAIRLHHCLQTLM